MDGPAGQAVAGRVVPEAPVRTARRRSSSRSRTSTGRRRRYRSLELAGILIVAIGLSVGIATWRDFFDLSVYHGAIRYWADGGSIYDFVAPHSTYGFTYTPFAALVLLPMAVMPWLVAIIATCAAIGVVTVMVVRWFIDPVAQRHGWTPWYAVGVVTACVIAFDPFRETLLFGQVNMYLVALVGFDLLFLTRRGSRFAGVGIGLATALKLTPGVFLVYLLVTGRWRAALTACSAAAAATLVGAALAPDASRVFWTDALWNTDRVGQLDYISNQSLNGAVARLNPLDPSTLLWALAVVAVLVVWAVRVRRAVAEGDEKTGFALTGVVTCLISPITWVHHLVWVMPALLVLLDRGLGASVRSPGEASGTGRSWLGFRPARSVWILLAVCYLVLGSRLIWAFDDSWTNPGVWFLSNAYVWVSLALLIGVPIAKAPAAPADPGPAQAPMEAQPMERPESPVVADAGAVVGAGIGLRDEAMAGVGGGERSVVPAR